MRAQEWEEGMAADKKVSETMHFFILDWHYYIHCDKRPFYTMKTFHK